jgi:biopolymer transport protein ExbB
MENYLQIYVLNGGPLMVPLILCSVLLVAWAVHSMIRLRPLRITPPELSEKAKAANSPNDRIAYANGLRNQTSPLARCVQMTLKELDLRSGPRPTRRKLDPIVHNAAAHVVDDLYDQIGPFGTIYTVAPLLGLLGTILGMMSAFTEFANTADRDLTQLSSGIQQALVTTLWGLGIAICAFIAGQYFQSRIRRYERATLPDTVTEIVAALFPRAQAPAETQAPRTAAPAARPTAPPTAPPTGRGEPSARVRSPGAQPAAQPTGDGS